MGRNSEENTGIDPKNASMWAVSGEAYFPCEKTDTHLPPGQYTIEFSQQRGIYFKKSRVILDGLITLPDADSDKVIKHIEKFWSRKSIYKEMDVLHKRGVLLWGPPGSGKTTTVQQLSKNIVDSGGISIYVKDPEISAQGLDILRTIEPTRPIVVMMEDIDAMTGGRHDSESQLLALLDGEMQIENVVFVATTNYPERLDKRLVNRPSRFDVVHKIDMPSAEARRCYLQHRAPESLLMKAYPNEDAAKQIELTRAEIEALDVKMSKAQEELAGFNAELEKFREADDESSIVRYEARVEATTTRINEIQTKLDGLSSTLETTNTDKVYLDYIVEKTDNFSIAHLKELIISLQAYDMPFEEAHKRLSKMQSSDISSKSSGETNI